MRMSPPDRKRGRDRHGPRTIAARTSGSRSRTSATAASREAQRFSAAVVLIFIVASTVISLYDLYLLITLLAP